MITEHRHLAINSTPGAGDPEDAPETVVLSTDQRTIPGMMRMMERWLVGSTLTLEQQEAIWDRWRAGEPARVIARMVRYGPAAVRRHLAVTGGIRPAPRRRALLRLSLTEREEISRGIAAGESARKIAARTGRSPSSVSREIARNGGRENYRAAHADVATWGRSRRPKVSKLDRHEGLRELVRLRLTDDWSPEQISSWLRRSFPDEPHLWISHEAIYRHLYISTRHALPSALTSHLRSRRPVRMSRLARKSGHGRGRLRNMVSIHDRPAHVEDRREVGHWEGDLIIGSTSTRSAIGTLVERTSGFLMLLHLPGDHTALTVSTAMIKAMNTLPEQLRLSVTWDQGREMAKHQEVTMATGMPIYFCDPHSPWQRGSNENTNGLLRQYFPKSTDLSFHGPGILDNVAAELNARPRKRHGYRTPAEVLTELFSN